MVWGLWGLDLSTHCNLQDLIEEDVMILDTYSEVFVWIGRGANDVEKKESLRTAQEYINTDPSGRDIDSTILLQACHVMSGVVILN